MYAETQNHRQIIHTLKEDISARLSFAELLALLPKSGRFYMSGRGLLLNFSQVGDFQEDGTIHLKMVNASSAADERKRKRKKHL